MRDEAEELRKTRRSGAESREAAYQDAIPHEGEHVLDNELRERQATVNKLTQEMRELQQVMN